jgi:hypothetical protein
LLCALCLPTCGKDQGKKHKPESEEQSRRTIPGAGALAEGGPAWRTRRGRSKNRGRQSRPRHNAAEPCLPNLHQPVDSSGADRFGPAHPLLCSTQPMTEPKADRVRVVL